MLNFKDPCNNLNKMVKSYPAKNSFSKVLQFTTLPPKPPNRWAQFKKDASHLGDDLVHAANDIADIGRDVFGGPLPSSKASQSNAIVPKRISSNTRLTNKAKNVKHNERQHVLRPDTISPSTTKQVTSVIDVPPTWREAQSKFLANNPGSQIASISGTPIVNNSTNPPSYSFDVGTWRPDGTYHGSNITLGPISKTVVNEVVVPGVSSHPATTTQIEQYVASRRKLKPLLVGVEPNPGPQKRILPKRKQAKISLGMPAPVAMSYEFINNNKMKSTLIKHVEQVLEITGSSSSYSLLLTNNLNPGLAGTFPWLSQAAQQYEAYSFRSIKYIYMPYVSSATAGYVAMNCDYNPQDDEVVEFSTKQAFTDYDGAVQGNSWEAMTFNIKCPNPEGPKRRSMRYGTLPSPYDLHNYDHATFNLAVGGQSGTTPIGTLFVSYVVELYRPRIAAANGNSGYADLTSTTSITASAFLGSAQTTSSNNIPISVSNNIVTVNRVGRFIVDYNLDGTTLVGVASVLTAGTGSTIVLNNNSIVNTAATSLVTKACIIDISVVGGQFTYAPITSGATFTIARFTIAQIPSNLSLIRPTLESLVEQLSMKIKRLERSDEEKDYLNISEPSSAVSSSMSALNTSVSTEVLSTRSLPKLNFPRRF